MARTEVVRHLCDIPDDYVCLRDAARRVPNGYSILSRAYRDGRLGDGMKWAKYVDELNTDEHLFVDGACVEAAIAEASAALGFWDSSGKFHQPTSPQKGAAYADVWVEQSVLNRIAIEIRELREELAEIRQEKSAHLSSGPGKPEW